MCQRYSEMKFKSEIPKFFQQFKKEKGEQNNDTEIRHLLDIYLKQNQNNLIHLFLNEGRRWDEVKKLTDMGEETI